MVNIPSACDLYHGYVTVRQDITEDLEVRDDLGVNFVAADLHHPLIEPLVRAWPGVMHLRLGWGIALCQPAYAPVVVHTEQDSSTPTVGERDQLLREFVTGNHVTLEFDAGIFSVCAQVAQFSLGHRSVSEVMLTAILFVCLPGEHSEDARLPVHGGEVRIVHHDGFSGLPIALRGTRDGGLWAPTVSVEDDGCFAPTFRRGRSNRSVARSRGLGRRDTC